MRPIVATIDRIEILGIRFSRVTVATAADRLEQYIASRSPTPFTSVNVAVLVWARSSRSLLDYYNACDMVIPDGMGIYYASRLLRRPTVAFTSAVHVMYEMLERSARRGHRVFLLGTEADILERGASEARRRYPGLQLVGTRNGFFAEEEEHAIVEEIRAARVDVLIIGIPTLRKEEFLRRNINQLGVPVCLGVGGALDVLAGVYRLAPPWLRVIGLEWLYRLVQEPRRLWRRYLTTNTVFLFLVLRELVLSTLRDLRSWLQ